MVQQLDNLPQLHRGLGLADQGQLEKAVVQLDLFRRKLHHPAQRGGVAHRPEEELPLDQVPVHLRLQGDGLQKRQLPGAFQHIGQVAQGSLHLGGRLIRGLGKGPKGGHIQKPPPLKAAQVQPVAFPMEDLLRCPGRLLGHPQGIGKVVGGAYGHKPQGHGGAQLPQKAHGVAQGAVPAAAHQ